MVALLVNKIKERLQLIMRFSCNISFHSLYSFSKHHISTFNSFTYHLHLQAPVSSISFFKMKNNSHKYDQSFNSSSKPFLSNLNSQENNNVKKQKSSFIAKNDDIELSESLSNSYNDENEILDAYLFSEDDTTISLNSSPPPIVATQDSLVLKEKRQKPARLAIMEGIPEHSPAGLKISKLFD